MKHTCILISLDFVKLFAFKFFKELSIDFVLTVEARAEFLNNDAKDEIMTEDAKDEILKEDHIFGVLIFV